MKKCSKCGSFGPFYKRKSRKSGLTSRCKVCIDEDHSFYARKNRDKIRKYDKSWNASKPNKSLNDKRYRIKNLSKVKLRQKKYRKNNSEYINVLNENYRARNLNAEGTFSIQEWLDLLKKNNFSCKKCGLTEKEHENKFNQKLHKDHIIPLSKGGTNYITNIQPLCRSCNSSKRNSLEN